MESSGEGGVEGNKPGQLASGSRPEVVPVDTPVEIGPGGGTGLTQRVIAAIAGSTLPTVNKGDLIASRDREGSLTKEAFDRAIARVSDPKFSFGPILPGMELETEAQFVRRMSSMDQNDLRLLRSFCASKDMGSEDILDKYSTSATETRGMFDLVKDLKKSKMDNQVILRILSALYDPLTARVVAVTYWLKYISSYPAMQSSSRQRFIGRFSPLTPVDKDCFSLPVSIPIRTVESRPEIQRSPEKIARRKVAEFQDIGRKSNQEDSSLVREDGDITLMCVADGVGGNKDGEVASQAITNELKKSSLSPADVRGAIINAHTMLIRKAALKPDEYSPQSTVAVALIDKDNILTALHAGDSRVVVVRDGKIIFKTVDHINVQIMLEAGQVTAQQALTHPNYNVVRNTVGGEGGFRDDHFEIYTSTMKLTEGDVVLVFSDGMEPDVDGLGDNLRIIEAIRKVKTRENVDPDQIIQALKDTVVRGKKAIDPRKNGADNIIVLCTVIK